MKKTLASKLASVLCRLLSLLMVLRKRRIFVDKTSCNSHCRCFCQLILPLSICHHLYHISFTLSSPLPVVTPNGATLACYHSHCHHLRLLSLAFPSPVPVVTCVAIISACCHWPCHYIQSPIDTRIPIILTSWYLHFHHLASFYSHCYHLCQLEYS